VLAFSKNFIKCFRTYQNLTQSMYAGEISNTKMREREREIERERER